MPRSGQRRENTVITQTHSLKHYYLGFRNENVLRSPEALGASCGRLKGIRYGQTQALLDCLRVLEILDIYIILNPR